MAEETTAAAAQNLTEAQLGLLEDGLFNLALVIGGMLLRWWILSRQREMLVGSVCCPQNPPTGDTFPQEALSTLLILWVLVGFEGLSERALALAAQGEGNLWRPRVDLCISQITLLLGLIRAVLFFTARSQAAQVQQEETAV